MRATSENRRIEVTRRILHDLDHDVVQPRMEWYYRDMPEGALLESIRKARDQAHGVNCGRRGRDWVHVIVDLRRSIWYPSVDTPEAVPEELWEYIRFFMWANYPSMRLLSDPEDKGAAGAPSSLNDTEDDGQ